MYMLYCMYRYICICIGMGIGMGMCICMCMRMYVYVFVYMYMYVGFSLQIVFHVGLTCGVWGFRFWMMLAVSLTFQLGAGNGNQQRQPTSSTIMLHYFRFADNNAPHDHVYCKTNVLRQPLQLQERLSLTQKRSSMSKPVVGGVCG